MWVLFADSGHNIYNDNITIRLSAKWILTLKSHFGPTLTGFKFDQYDTDWKKNYLEHCHKASLQLQYTSGPPSIHRRPHFEIWISLRPVGQSWSHFIWSIIGVGEKLHKGLGLESRSELRFPQQPIVPIDLKWRKCCPIDSVFIFYLIFIRLAVNQDRHKISKNFEFGPDQTILFGVTRLWASKNFL